MAADPLPEPSPDAALAPYPLPPADLRRLMSFVRNVARKISNSDEAESDAMLGLTKALRTYDPDNVPGASLSTYVLHRVRGEVLDGLRERDHLTRGDRKRVRAGEIDLDGTPVLWNPISLQAITADSDTTLQFDPPDPGYDWEKLLDDRSTRQRLDAIWRLVDLTQPPRTAAMLRSYYLDGKAMIDVGAEFGVTESRVCQILKKAHTEIAALCGVELPTPAGRGEEGRRRNARRQVAGVPVQNRRREGRKTEAAA